MKVFTRLLLFQVLLFAFAQPAPGVLRPRFPLKVRPPWPHFIIVESDDDEDSLKIDKTVR